MFPHPNTVFEVRTLQNRDMLAVAARERLAREATRNAPAPSWIDRGRKVVSHILALIAATIAMSPSTRRPASAWR